MNGKEKQQKDPLLVVKDWSVSFVQYSTGLKYQYIQVIEGLNLDIYPGEIVAVLGSSGSGKSLLAHGIMGILPGNARVQGALYYQNQELTSELQERLRGYEISLIPQSVNALNPLMKVGQQVIGPFNGEKTKGRLRQLLERYRLKPETEQLYPFQLSGGMARRVLSAGAVMGEPKLIIADEPTPGLHAEVVQETLDHLKKMAQEGCGVLMITHDIEAALTIADRIAVFYAGTTLEIAHRSDFKDQGEALRHPYSKALWQALPQNGFKPVRGFQPQVADRYGMCPYAERCQNAQNQCREKMPELRGVRQGEVRCHYAT